MDTVDGEKSCPGDESIAIVYKASSTPSVAGFVLLIDIDWWHFRKQTNRCRGPYIETAFSVSTLDLQTGPTVKEKTCEAYYCHF